jgi:hypothetical protein
VATEQTRIPVPASDLNHGGIHADGGYPGQVRQSVVQVHGLLTQLSHFARRVLAFQSCQIDHGQRQLQRSNFRILLDAARAETRHPLLDTHLIHVGHPV